MSDNQHAEDPAPWNDPIAQSVCFFYASKRLALRARLAPDPRAHHCSMMRYAVTIYAEALERLARGLDADARRVLGRMAMGYLAGGPIARSLATAQLAKPTEQPSGRRGYAITPRGSRVAQICAGLDAATPQPKP